jgi:cellulase
MPSKFTITTALVAALTGTATGHTLVEKWTIGGKTYDGFQRGSKGDPGNKSPAWWTNQGWGYTPVKGNDLNNPNIIAHIDADPSPYTAKAPAGSQATFKWAHKYDGVCDGVNGAKEVGWDCSHHGFTATYLAPCNSDCAKVDKTKLEFFKIDEKGLLGYPGGRFNEGGSLKGAPGYWGTDVIFYNDKNDNTYTITIPKDIPSGNYVMRTEVMSFHNSNRGQFDELQFWPQAFNIEITGGDDSAKMPAGVKGMELYSRDDELLNWDLYNHPADKLFPNASGPPMYNASGKNVASAPAPSEIPTSIVAPIKNSTSTTAPSEKPTSTAVPSEVPTSTVVPSDIATSTVAASEKPTSTAVPSEKPTSATIPSEEPTSATAPNAEPTITSAPSDNATSTDAPCEKTRSHAKDYSV